MTILSDVDLKREYGFSWNISPFDAELIGPASIDMRLGSEFWWNAPRGPNQEPGLEKSMWPTYQTFVVGEDNPLSLFTSDPAEPHNLLRAKGCAKYEDSLVIPPHSFVLASTQEYVWVSDALVGRVEGRSSIGRLGITIHSTAGLIDPGFEGNITLEVTNHLSSFVEIPVGTALCQLVLERCETPAKNHYGVRKSSRYRGQRSTTLSRMEKK